MLRVDRRIIVALQSLSAPYEAGTATASGGFLNSSR